MGIGAVHWGFLTMVRTQQELAEAVGYSRVTVSKALAGHPSVQPATRDKIIIRARELGYRPSAAARAMRSGRCGAVALVTGVQCEDSFAPLPLLHGIHHALSRRDLRMMFTEASIDALDDDGHVPDFLEELTVDGLLMNFTQNVPPRLVQLLEHYRVPTVWLNLDLPNDAVYPDDEHGGRIAAEYLLTRGHQRIAYLNPRPQSHYSTRARKAGYEKTMTEAGLQPRSWVRANPGPSDRDTVALTAQMLSDPERPTAVVCYEAADAMRLAVACAQAGLTISRDISVVVIAHQPVVGIELTFAQAFIPFEPMAEEAVQMLEEKIESSDGRTKPSRAVPYSPVVDGDSVGPPPAI